jgi:hypothetical protein
MELPCGCADEKTHDEVLQAVKDNEGKNAWDFENQTNSSAVGQAVWEGILVFGSNGILRINASS